MSARFAVGDMLRIRFISVRTRLPVERVGQVVHVIVPGEVPDMCWCQRDGTSWSDTVVEPWRSGAPRPVPACGVHRYVVRYGEGLYHVVPDGALDPRSDAWKRGYRVELVDCAH